MPGKTFSNNNCLCNKKCIEKIACEERKKAFESFWKLKSFTAQNVFLCGLIKQKKPEVKRPRDQSRFGKTVSNKYFIHRQGETVKVCKKYFLQTFQISDGRMSRAINKIKQGEQPGSDNRGHGIPTNKISEERMNCVRKHIENFPSYQSHYTRTKNPNRRYLSSDLNVTLMHSLYSEYCQEQGTVPVSLDIYRRTFNNEYNLHFHVPQKDTCSTCDAYKLKKAATTDDNEIRQFEVEHEVHLRKAELARTSMKNDTEKAQSDDSYYALTFDLEKALAFPKLTTSIAYYKRNMYIYNLGCHELSSGLGYMYGWDEVTASRGSQEISACVKKHIELRAANSKHVVLYSDSCTGQNRNWNFALALLQLVQSENNSIEIIDHKFMVSGHSFLPNDSDFGSIETHSKDKHIYVPEDWFSVIVRCRKKKRFIFTKMHREDFKDLANLTKSITKRKTNTDNQPVSWLKMQWIRVKQDEPFSLFYKETLNEYIAFSQINIRPSKQKGRPTLLKNIQLECLYTAPRPVTPAKKRDMCDLLPYIPPVHHGYFRNLISSDDVNDEAGPLPDVEENND